MADSSQTSNSLHGVISPVYFTNIAEAFSVSCQVPSSPSSDWYLDTGASAHMTSNVALLDSSIPYTGSDCVIVGNGARLSITHVGSCTINNSIVLRNVLVVPNITKNLLSVSKLSVDSEVEVLFTYVSFQIKSRISKDTLARGRRRHGLYVLDGACSF